MEIISPQRGGRRKLVDQAFANARDSLGRRLAETSVQRRLLDQVAETFELDGPPQRIEVYDNSHIQGDKALGAMVVASPEGFEKGQYRKFNIKTAQTNDDFGMMREVMAPCTGTGIVSMSCRIPSMRKRITASSVRGSRWMSDARCSNA